MGRYFAFLTYTWSKHKALIIFSMIFFATIQFLLVYFNSTLDFAPMIELILSQLPPQFKEMYGEEILNQISLEGTLAFGMEHPLVITLFTFMGINISSSNLASGSDNKNIEIILSHPFTRSELLLSLILFVFCLYLLLIISAFIGAAGATYFYHRLSPDLIKKMLLLEINAFLLHIFIFSYSVFFSIFFREISKAIRWSAMISLSFYFLNVISALWDKISFTKHFNFFSYFMPQSIIAEKGNATFDILVLAIASITLLIISYRIFLRKDIL